jgi:hypothetical protein
MFQAAFEAASLGNYLIIPRYSKTRPTVRVRRLLGQLDWPAFAFISSIEDIFSIKRHLKGSQAWSNKPVMFMKQKASSPKSVLDFLYPLRYKGATHCDVGTKSGRTPMTVATPSRHARRSRTIGSAACIVQPAQSARETVSEKLARYRKQARVMTHEQRGTDKAIKRDSIKRYDDWKDLRKRATKTK